MSVPSSSHYFLMLEADAMSLSLIIQRGFLSNKPASTFSTAPGTDDSHVLLALMTIFDNNKNQQQESGRRAQDATRKKIQRKFGALPKMLSDYCI